LGPLQSSNSSGQIFAQASFFNNLIRTGYSLELLKNGAEWKQFHFKFGADSCALECREDRDKPTSKLLAFISLRKFAISFSPTDPLRFAIKTPNKVYQARTRDQPMRTLWLGWLTSVQKDSHVMAEHALRTTGHHDKIFTTKDKVRPPYWVPKEEAEFCACCHNNFSAFSGRHTCRDCGFIFCSLETCFTDGSVKRCNNCLSTHQTVNADGTQKKAVAPTPIFNETSSTESQSYFLDLNQDPLLKKQALLDQQRTELEKRQQTQLIIDSQAGLTTVNNQTVYIGEDVINNKNAITNLLANSTDPKKRLQVHNQKVSQLYAQREIQRVDSMKRYQSGHSFGDILLMVLVLCLALYFMFSNSLHSLFDVFAKSL
jgi:hypothetical protein